MAILVGIEPWPSPPVIVPGGRLGLGCGAMTRGGFGAPASGASPWSDAANCLLAWPFVLETQTTFYKGFWVNGSGTIGGNREVGIWDDSYNKIVTTGAIAASGTSVPQASVFASSATPTLGPGQYYIGMACSVTTTGNQFRWPVTTIGAGIQQGLGCWKQASITLGSLAATATPGDITNIAFPVCGLITRSGYGV